MNIENILEQLKQMDRQEKEDFLKNIQYLIDEQYIQKSKVQELQQEMNELVKENNIVRQKINQKFSKTEHQTIAFQLGKSILDVLNGHKKVRQLPAMSLNLALEAFQRKGEENLTHNQKKLYALMKQSETPEKRNIKQISVFLLKKVLEKLDNEKNIEKEVPFLEGEYKDLQGKLINDLPENDVFELKKIEPVKIEPQLKRDNVLKETEISSDGSKLKIACIMDEFTYFCFSPEATLLQLTPENWLEEVSDFQPDILFIESAWQGKESLWKAKVSQNSSEVGALINYCHMHSIKTLFWNKEDPVHFGTFIEVAKQVDVVFTTDIDCIGRYKAQVGHDNVYLLPFAAQPQVHNPIEKYERKDAFNFAGSFYLKYPERQRDFVNLTDVAINFKKLEIYDRNYNKPHPHYTFPEKYQQYILGRLEPHEIDKAYKGYNYGINMNTIKQSQSMFARRVFEMLASNTIVLSNYSRGVRNFFGDLVLCSDNSSELEQKLKQTLSSKDELDKFRLLGLRKVLSEHTYEDRLNYILNKLKIKNEQNRYSVAIIAQTDSVEDFEYIYSMFKEQSYQDKVLIVKNSGQNVLPKYDDVFEVNQKSDIFSNLNKLNIDFVGFFNSKNCYLKNYIEDLALSFRYLNEQGVKVATKDSFYDFIGSLKLESGIEYKMVDSYTLSRSMISAGEILSKTNLLDQFLSDKSLEVSDAAFSIDRFNYIENGAQASLEEQKKVSTFEDGLDIGVRLKEQLLPYAEKIQPLFEDNRDYVTYDAKYFSESITNSNKLIKFTIKGNEVNIISSLDAKKHSYLPILSKVGVKTSVKRVKLFVDCQSNFDTQVVVEFFDFSGNKKDFNIFSINEELEILLPDGADYFNLSLRLKGSGQAVLKKICYSSTVENSQKKFDLENSSVIILDADFFNKNLVKPSSNQILFKKIEDKFVIKTTLAPTKHCYMYIKESFTREELNLVLNSEFELKAHTSAEEVRIVFEFQDENKQKISHSMNPILGGHALAIPMECRYVRIGFKVVGAGLTEIEGLHIGTVKNPINNFISKSKTLVVAKQYPSYSDLYKYGFLHTRLRAYKRENHLTDMFKVTTSVQEVGFNEFEGIDIFSHNHEMLDQLLASGVYSKVCIHLIDKKIWDVVKKYQDKVQIIIWVHGAEIQVWQRREFEFENMSEQEIVRQKKLSDQRRHFWRNLVLNELRPNTQFVFVSQYFLNESEQDLAVKFPTEQSHIIHNYIDTNFFQYMEKVSTQRFKLLSIRPFASRKYANDLTVKAIEELAKYPNFSKFDIAIYGDGALFEKTTQPLQKFSNVQLHKTFLNHSEIAKLHKEYGVFIVPTRMDSQGVSRDEAMSSGLIPVTTSVTAIPEFVDNMCGVLVDGEDYIDMAKQIYQLSKNARKFKQLSKQAAIRVNEQSGYTNTICKELDLLKN